MIFCDFPAFNALFCLLYTKKGIRILLSYPHFLLVDIFFTFTYSHVDNFFIQHKQDSSYFVLVFLLFYLAPWLTSHKELIRIVRSFSLSLVSCDFQNQTPDQCGYLLVQLLFFCCIFFSICSWHGQLA